MDYEKLYKEALERAKEKHDEYIHLDNDNVVPKDIEYIFPELAESEDEKIRKALISVLKSDFENDTTIHDIRVGDIISWLEKQGEQKPMWSEEDKEKFEDVLHWFSIFCEKNQTISGIKESFEWLKSPRPQNRWKPSEEQLNAFEHFVRSIGESGYASPYDNNTKLLYSLLNDLKNL